MRHLFALFILAGALASAPPVSAQRFSTAHAQGPVLNVGTRWRECAIQLSAALGQGAFRQFTGEAAMVVHFRPLLGATPLGRGRTEFAIVQWETGIDSHDSAWNDTFVHPDSTHVLFEGNGLQFPGLTARVGVTDRVDVGLYYTRNPLANYGFVGGQVQMGWGHPAPGEIAMATRFSAVTLFGPEDVDFSMLGAEVVASRAMRLGRSVVLSPFVSAAGILSMAREHSSAVNLDDERVVGLRGALGASAEWRHLSVGVEYSVAAVNSLNFKVGISR